MQAIQTDCWKAAQKCVNKYCAGKDCNTFVSALLINGALNTIIAARQPDLCSFIYSSLHNVI